MVSEKCVIGFSIKEALQGGAYIVPGSKADEVCQTCGEKVWLAPSSRRMLVELPSYVVFCMEHGLAAMAEAEEAEVEIAPGALEEMENARRDRR